MTRIVAPLSRMTLEEKIIQQIIDFGKSLGLGTMENQIGSVIIIKKPVTKERAHVSIIVLKGHLDMVLQKEADSDFDLETKGTQMFVQGY